MKTVEIRVSVYRDEMKHTSLLQTSIGNNSYESKVCFSEKDSFV